MQVDQRRLASMHAAIALPAQAKAAKQLVDALEKVQTLARRAWGIQDGAPPEPPKDRDDAALLEDLRTFTAEWKAREAATAATGR
jgi:cytosine/adenosine deaminase-related metal-dependent hydrolase